MKSKLLLLLTLLLITSNIHAQDLNIKVDKKGKVGFEDPQGNVVIKCQYESATPFEKGVSIVSKSKKFGIINTSGKLILPLKYSQISKWNDDLFLIKAGKKMGLADHGGKVVLAAKYSLISKSNCYGKAIIAAGGKATTNEKKTYMNNAKYGIIDSEGRVLIVPKYKGLYEFSFDATDVYPYKEGMRLAFSYHYVNDTLITDCKYLGFSKNGSNIFKCGIMNEGGVTLMKESKYDYIMQPSNDIIRYYISNKKETKYGYYNLLTKKELEIGTERKKISEMNYWSHGDFMGDIAPVNGNSWSFIDKKGERLRTGYSNLRHNQHLGLWAAENSDKKWEVFDDVNKDVPTLTGYDDIIFPTRKEDVELYAVKKDNQYGMINRLGNIVVPMQYDKILAVSYNAIPVMKGDKWGILSTDNKQIVPIEYVTVLLPTEMNQKDYWIKKSDNLYYHFNARTKKLSSTGFKVVNNFIGGIAHVCPIDFSVENTPVNRAQVYYPNADQANISQVNASTKASLFGYLLNVDDVIVLDKPISTAYLQKARERINSLENRKLTENEAKSLILELTKENRSYNLNEVISEDEWNY